MDFIREVNTLINMFVRLSVELPLYKLYDNKLMQEFRRAVDTSMQLRMSAVVEQETLAEWLAKTWQTQSRLGSYVLWW